MNWCLTRWIEMNRKQSGVESQQINKNCCKQMQMDTEVLLCLRKYAWSPYANCIQPHSSQNISRETHVRLCLQHFANGPICNKWSLLHDTSTWQSNEANQTVSTRTVGALTFAYIKLTGCLCGRTLYSAGMVQRSDTYSLAINQSAKNYHWIHKWIEMNRNHSAIELQQINKSCC